MSHHNLVYGIHFSVSDVDGNLLDQSEEAHPLYFLAGHGALLPKLEEMVIGMTEGEKRQLTLEPEDAYGEYDEENIQVVQRSEFPAEIELEEGLELLAEEDDGEVRPFVVDQIEGDEVTIDFNHALAGETLTFEVHLIERRLATEEEIAHGHVHGAHGHHH
jgi:FKBP-type peptidyl-prolyl cis-trans isomerase SlyD